MVASAVVVYPRRMDTLSSAHGSRRGSQEETGPFPLELEVVPRRRKRVVRREGRSQEETAPFPLEFEVVARKAAQSQDETAPFLLEFTVILPDGEPAFVRTARPPRGAGARGTSLPRALPLLKWHGVEASVELREYAARIAAGESLPPYRGPILASGDFPCQDSSAAAARHGGPAAAALPADDSRAFVKFALALMIMTAFVVAAVALGDDAQLRSVGKSIGTFFTGKDDPFESARPAPEISPSAPSLR